MRTCIAAALAATAFAIAGCAHDEPLTHDERLNYIMLGNQLMNQRPYAPPPPRVCHTIRSGMGYQTICN